MLLYAGSVAEVIKGKNTADTPPYSPVRVQNTEVISVTIYFYPEENISKALFFQVISDIKALMKKTIKGCSSFILYLFITY